MAGYDALVRYLKGCMQQASKENKTLFFAERCFCITFEKFVTEYVPSTLNVDLV